MINGSRPQDDLRAIVDNLQDEIRRHRVLLGEIGPQEPVEPLAEVRRHQWVNSHLPIGWPTMPKRIVPRIIAIAQKVVRRLLRWYINPLIDQQNRYNAAVSQFLSDHVKVTSDQLGALEAQVGRLEAGNEANVAHSEHQLGALDAQSRRQEAEIGNRLAHLEQAMQQDRETRGDVRRSAESAFASLRHDIDAHRERQGKDGRARSETIRLRLQRLENWRVGAMTQGPRAPAQAGAASASSPPLDGYLLGATYRNSVQLSDRLSDYDDLLSPLIALKDPGRGPRQATVLDIGCGRGELVAHLAELGLDAYGIDMDHDSIAIGRAAGRRVRVAEAAAHLESLQDASLAAVILIQVIEHFDISDLQPLLRLCAQKLSPGGLLIAETINPTCLWALSNWYLMDPSHHTPLHPQVAQFLLEQAGLWRVTYRYLHPVPPEARLGTFAAEPDEATIREPDRTFSRNFEQLNQFLYGPQDYAAIAHKPED